jgi:LysM repeat protein
VSKNSVLHVGRRLKLPAGSEVPLTPTPPPAYHVVKRGDTLSGLAVRYGTSVSHLCRLNGISSKAVLRVGKKLKLM